MCHHLFISLLEESRVAHDQTETRPRSRQPDERTNERTNEIGHGSDSRIYGELQKDQTTSYGKAGMRQGYISPHIALHRRGNYPFLGYRRMYVLILLHFDS